MCCGQFLFCLQLGSITFLLGSGTGIDSLAAPQTTTTTAIACLVLYIVTDCAFSAWMDHVGLAVQSSQLGSEWMSLTKINDFARKKKQGREFYYYIFRKLWNDYGSMADGKTTNNSVKNNHHTNRMTTNSFEISRNLKIIWHTSLKRPWECWMCEHRTVRASRLALSMGKHRMLAYEPSVGYDMKKKVRIITIWRMSLRMEAQKMWSNGHHWNQSTRDSSYFTLFDLQLKEWIPRASMPSKYTYFRFFRSILVTTRRTLDYSIFRLIYVSVTKIKRKNAMSCD